MKIPLKKPSPAMAVAIMALVIATATPAAAATILITDPGQLGPDVVTTPAIADNTVQSRDIKNGSISITDIAKTAPFADLNAVTGPKANLPQAVAWSAVKNVGNMFDPNQPTTLTIKKDGVYDIRAWVKWQQDSTGTYRQLLVTSGAEAKSDVTVPIVGASTDAAVSTVVSLKAGDKVSVLVSHNSTQNCQLTVCNLNLVNGYLSVLWQAPLP